MTEVQSLVEITPGQRESLFDFRANSLQGKSVALEQYRGSVLLIVNVASRCVYTAQYRALESLYQSYKDRGFVILGFPCNQFANQEPKSDSEIQQFCSLTYNVTFPMFAKVDVNGATAHPLYRYLTRSCPGLLGSTSIKWNFTKFLAGRDGSVLQRYSPMTSPSSLKSRIEQLLAVAR